MSGPVLRRCQKLACLAQKSGWPAASKPRRSREALEAQLGETQWGWQKASWAKLPLKRATFA